MVSGDWNRNLPEEPRRRFANRGDGISEGQAEVGEGETASPQRIGL